MDILIGYDEKTGYKEFKTFVNVSSAAAVCAVPLLACKTSKAGDEAKFITGVVLPVDGGQYAKIGL